MHVNYIGPVFNLRSVNVTQRKALNVMNNSQKTTRIFALPSHDTLGHTVSKTIIHGTILSF